MWFCVVLAALSAAAHLWSEYRRGPAWAVYVAKPLTTSLLIAAALLAPSADPAYRALIVAGLICSLSGDVFLMLPKDRFIAGLVSFLAAHVFYSIAFSANASLTASAIALIPFLIAAASIMRLLWPHLGRLRLPVIIYVVVLVIMAALAGARALEMQTPLSWAAAAGAALFVFSDATLALNRFRTRFHSAQFVIMTTYVAAQMLIAISVAEPARS